MRKLVAGRPDMEGVSNIDQDFNSQLKMNGRPRTDNLINPNLSIACRRLRAFLVGKTMSRE